MNIRRGCQAFTIAIVLGWPLHALPDGSISKKPRFKQLMFNVPFSYLNIGQHPGERDIVVTTRDNLNGPYGRLINLVLIDTRFDAQTHAIDSGTGGYETAILEDEPGNIWSVLDTYGDVAGCLRQVYLFFRNSSDGRIIIVRLKNIDTDTGEEDKKINDAEISIFEKQENKDYARGYSRIYFEETRSVHIHTDLCDEQQTLDEIHNFVNR